MFLEIVQLLKLSRASLASVRFLGTITSLNGALTPFSFACRGPSRFTPFSFACRGPRFPLDATWCSRFITLFFGAIRQRCRICFILIHFLHFKCFRTMHPEHVGYEFLNI